MKKYDKLSNKEKHNFKEFLILTFEFSDDELAAIDKQKPMTMELFSSCMDKCTEHGLYKLFERLLDEYPELSEYSGRFYTSIPEIGNRRSDVKETALPF